MNGYQELLPLEFAPSANPHTGIKRKFKKRISKLFECQKCGKTIENKWTFKRTYCSRECKSAVQRTGITVKTYKCEICFKEFVRPLTGNKIKRFCSKQCSHIWGKQHLEEYYRDKREHGKISSVCAACGKEYQVYKKELERGRKLCSRKCITKYCQDKLIISSCLYCKKEMKLRPFQPKTGKGKFCNIKCSIEYQKINGNTLVSCAICGTQFKVVNSRLKNGNGRFCSMSCRNRHLLINRIIGHKNGHRGGKRDDLGIYVRSSWEANYARYLNWLKDKGEIISWEYEVDTFWFEGIKRGNVAYTPDFKVTEKDGSIIYHEVKGYMDDKSKVKLNRMAKYHPDIKIIIIGHKEYKELKKIKQLIPNWEE